MRSIDLHEHALDRHARRAAGRSAFGFPALDRALIDAEAAAEGVLAFADLFPRRP